jgi:epoxide hydrolase-like predicted phosphatase
MSSHHPIRIGEKYRMTINEKIRAIIWDLGGVILRTEDPSLREKWEKRFGLEAWGLANLIFRSEISQLASVGKASVDDIWSALQEELNLDNEELEQLKKDFFTGDRLDESLVAFIRQLKGPYKIGMITNAWPDIRHWIENEWKIADAFDHIIISAEVGIVKPDPAIYELCLQALNVEPDEAIFIDDFRENIEGAKSVGMQAIHFQDPKQASTELKEKLDL